MRKISLKSARVEAGFSQKKVASILNISNRTLWNWEHYHTFPSAEMVEALCELYGMSYDDINFLPTNPL